jgi:hypothetical protein
MASDEQIIRLEKVVVVVVVVVGLCCIPRGIGHP